MHLTLNQADVGSTPTAPTKDAPVTQLADVSGLNPDCCEFDSRRGYSGDRARAARQSHKLRSVSATLTPASKCRCDVTGNMRLSYSLHAGSTPVACSRCRRGVTGNTGARDRSRYGFNPHRLIQMCWCSSTAEQSPCKRKVAGSNPVTSPRMRMWCSGKHPWLPTRRHEFESRLSLQIMRV